MKVPACRAAVRQGYMASRCGLAAPRALEVEAEKAIDSFVPVCEGHYMIGQVALVDLLPETAP